VLALLEQSLQAILSCTERKSAEAQ
jgi:hypothetical protein